MTAVVMDIKRFAVHDGDGIRTTVFLKGCPLKCVWCHNPEGLAFEPQLSYVEKKCIGCGECVTACGKNAHSVTKDGHIFNRELCIACGECEQACLGEALKLYGKRMTVEELVPILSEDISFYESSGGGVTISGGECLVQYEFCKSLLKELKSRGINTAVDTSGYVSRKAFEAVMPYTDVFLYDLKAKDSTVHEKCTGRPNEQIIVNIKYLDSMGAKIEVRYPYVPGMNDGECEEIAKFVSTLKNLTKVRILPYHSYAGSKYVSLGMENTMPTSEMPDEKTMEKARNVFKLYGIAVCE